MGRGKDWRHDECKVLAQAWIKTSKDPIKGTSQRTSEFWHTCYQHFLSLCPLQHEAGRFRDRSANSVKNYWFDYVQPEANKIQASLSKVLAKKPTGNLSELQKINIAVALHLGKIEKFDYCYKDFDARCHWKCFSAWYDVLRLEPKWARDTSQKEGTPVQLAQRLAAVNSTGTALDQSLAAPSCWY